MPNYYSVNEDAEDAFVWEDEHGTYTVYYQGY
jgi:hypothetical protein